MRFLPERCRGRRPRRARVTAALALAPLALAVAVAGCAQQPAAPSTSGSALTSNPAVDPGSPLGGRPAQDQPWIEVVSASGKILFRHDGRFSQPGWSNAMRTALAQASG